MFRAREKRNRIGVCDVTSAYLHASIEEAVWLKLPDWYTENFGLPKGSCRQIFNDPTSCILFIFILVVMVAVVDLVLWCDVGLVSSGGCGMLRSVRRLVQTEARLKSLGIELPPPGAPKASYRLVSWHSPTMLFVSGHLPAKLDGSLITGTLGSGGMKVEEGKEAARWCGLNLISTLKAELGDLDRVEQVVKLFGIVRSKDDFSEQHLVMNGCSELMAEVFEERGVHARSAIGSNALPLGVSVEVEAIVKVKA